MKGHYILIDPFARTVTEIKPIPDAEMGRTVGPDYMDVVTLVRNSDGVACCLAVDDTGLYRENQRFWSFAYDPGQIYAGKGLLFAADSQGASMPLAVPAKILAREVVWRDVKFVGNTTTEGEEYSEPFGAKVHTISIIARFEPEGE